MAGEEIGFVWTLEIPEVKVGELPWAKVDIAAGRDPKFPDARDGCIPIKSMNFELNYDRPFRVTAKAKEEKKVKYPEFRTVEFDKEADGTSPTLYRFCLSGERLKVATFVGWVVDAEKPGDQVNPVFWLQLEECGISSVNFQSESLSESYEMQFGFVRWGYERAGTHVRSVGAWNFQWNKPGQ